MQSSLLANYHQETEALSSTVCRNPILPTLGVRLSLQVKVQHSTIVKCKLQEILIHRPQEVKPEVLFIEIMS